MDGDQIGSERIELQLSALPADDEIRVLEDGLEQFNQRAASGHERTKHQLAVWMRTEERILGGAYGDTHYGWLYLTLLWVDGALRSQGWGRQLVDGFEAEGIERGCHAAWVDTYEFQAPGFYQRLGYREFERLEDFPPGSARLFYWEPLPGGDSATGTGADSSTRYR